MPNQSIITTIAEGLRTGLPHPGDQDRRPQLIIIPGMSHRGIPPQILEKFASDAGLPSSDMPTLIAEAIVNLIETQGDSEIVSKTELKELRNIEPEPEVVPQEVTTLRPWRNE